MSRSKKNRKNKTAKKNATNKAKPAVASVAVETPKIKEACTLRVVDPRVKRECRNFSISLACAIEAAIEDRVQDCRYFLGEAKSARKSANKLINDPRQRIKRTPIRKIEEALVNYEREQKAKAVADAEALVEHLKNLDEAYKVIGFKTGFDHNSCDEDFLLQLRLVVIDWVAGNSLKGKETANRILKKVKLLLPKLDFSEVEELIFKSFRRAPKSENATVKYVDQRLKRSA